MSAKISELPILSSLADNDVIAGVDTSANVTSKIEMITLKNYIDTNTQYTAGTNIDITNNVVSAPNVYNKTETDELLEEKDAQIEELQSEVDSLSTIFNAFPTESGEGESLTLDDTAEVKFKKFDLKGNTSQETTTGKNLLPNTLTSQTFKGLTFTHNEDGSVTINGTTSSTGQMNICSSGEMRLSAGTYILSSTNDVPSLVWMTIRDNNGDIKSMTNKSQEQFALDADTTTAFVYIYFNNGVTINNLTIYPMISTSGGDYEPYTNGASPNPSYPQQIHVASGDNEITIHGLNFLNNNKIVKGRLDNGVIGYESGTTSLEVTDNSITFTTNTNYRGVVTDFIRLQTDNPYIMFGWESATTAPIVSCYYYDKDKNYLSASSGAIYTNLLRYSNTIANAVYVRFYISLNTAGTQTINKPQVRFIDGSTQPTYEPYIGKSYPIHLGMENLWKNQITGFLPQSGSYPTTNSSYPNARYVLINLLAGQSITLSGITFDGSGRVRYIDKDTNQVVGNMTYLNSAYYTATHSFGDGFYEGTITAKKEVIIGIMDMSGAVNNLVVNYGTTPQTISETPIELCKIGNYEDKFIRTSGKNLFDVFSNVFLGSSSAKTPTISSDGKITSEANFATARGKGMFVELESNTTYTLSFKIDSIYASTGTARVFIEGKIYNETSPTTDLFTGTSYNTTGLKSITFTTPTIPEGQKCGIIFNGGWYTDANVSSTFSNVMIEKGSSASDYQPYGVGKWYLHKEIGKYSVSEDAITLKGTEYENIRYASFTKPLDFIGRGNFLYYKSYFNKATSGSVGIGGFDNANMIGKITPEPSNTTMWVGFSVGTTIQQMKTSLNGGLLYYVLSTPTTTEITYQPLIDQLNLLEKAMSKDSQTNISQVNNDLGFIIYAEAIKSLENVLDRIELLES